MQTPLELTNIIFEGDHNVIIYNLPGMLCFLTAASDKDGDYFVIACIFKPTQDKAMGVPVL